MAEGGPGNPGQNPDEERRGGPGSGLPVEGEQLFDNRDEDERIDAGLRRFLRAHEEGIAAGKKNIVSEQDRQLAEELLRRQREEGARQAAEAVYGEPEPARAAGTEEEGGGFWKDWRGEGVGPEEPVEAARMEAQRRSEATPLPQPTAGRRGMDHDESPGLGATADAIDDAVARAAGEPASEAPPSETQASGPYHRIDDEVSDRTLGEAHTRAGDRDEAGGDGAPAEHESRPPREAHEHQWRVLPGTDEEAQALNQLREANASDPLFDTTLHGLYRERLVRGGPDPGDVRPAPRDDMSQLWIAGYLAATTPPEVAERLLNVYESRAVRNDIAEAERLLDRMRRGQDVGVPEQDLPRAMAEAEAVRDPRRRAESREHVLRTIYGANYDRWLEQKAANEAHGTSAAEVAQRAEEQMRRTVIALRGQLLEIEDKADSSDKSINADHDYTYNDEGADLERLADEMRDVGLVEETEQHGLLISRARNADEARLVEDVNKALARVHALREEDSQPENTYMPEQPERGTEELAVLERDLQHIIADLDQNLSRHSNESDRARVRARAGRELRALRERAHDWVTVVNRPRESDVHGRGRGVTYDLVAVAPRGQEHPMLARFRRDFQNALARTEAGNRYRAAELPGAELVPTGVRGTSRPKFVEAEDVPEEYRGGYTIPEEPAVDINAAGRGRVYVEEEGELLEGDNARPERWLERLQAIRDIPDARERMRQLRLLHVDTERMRHMSDHQVGLKRGERSAKAYAAFDEAYAEAAREMLPREFEPMALPVGSEGAKAMQERQAEARAGLAAELIPELSRIDTQPRMVPVKKEADKKGKKDEGSTEEPEALEAVIERAQGELDEIIDRALDGGLILESDNGDESFPFEPVAGDAASQSFYEQARDMQGLIDHLEASPELAKQRGDALKNIEETLKRTQGLSPERQRREIMAAIRAGVEARALALAAPVTPSVRSGEGPRSERLLRQALQGRDGHTAPGSQEALVRAAEEAAREHLLYLGDEQAAGDYRPAAKRTGLRAGQYPQAEAALVAELQQRVVALEADPQGEKGVAKRSQTLLTQAMARLEQIAAEERQMAAEEVRMSRPAQNAPGGDADAGPDAGGAKSPNSQTVNPDDGEVESGDSGSVLTGNIDVSNDVDIESVTDNGATMTEVGERRRAAGQRIFPQVRAARTRGQLDRALQAAVKAGLLEDNMPNYAGRERREVPLRERVRPVDNSSVSRDFYRSVLEYDDAIASYSDLQYRVVKADETSGIEESALEELKRIFEKKEKPEQPITWTADLADNIVRLSRDRRLIENLARQLIDAERILPVEAPQGSRRATITYAGQRVALEAVEHPQDDDLSSENTENERLMSIIRRELLWRTPPARNRSSGQGNRRSGGR